jgi:hypothetical protein
LNWGDRRLKDGAATDLRSNTNVTAGLYYGLTKSITLVGEVSRTTSKPVAGADSRGNGVALEGAAGLAALGSGMSRDGGCGGSPPDCAMAKVRARLSAQR